ncbi:SAVED domain-containing protein [Sorangium sp. So ce1389]|uniref:SAVED domain-containing protein n=1 Tax=Sorangium sp. So ce1389 TaxID=3133336 RepID=UPI003F60577A
MKPPSLGATLGGARYQIRFFWRHALPMLYETRVQKVVLEHRGVDAVDDVVVYYAPPGVNDHGGTVDADFFQLKFHVAQTGAVSYEALTDPSWTGTKEPMLARFARAWDGIRKTHPNARLSLVTNWPWNPKDPIAPLLRGGGRLADEFFEKGPKSDVGKARTSWQKVSGLTEADFQSFARRLRFSTSAASQQEAEDWLRDRCQLAGLKPISAASDHSPYDDLGQRFIEQGRTEHTPDGLRELVAAQGLIATPVPPYRSTFAVRTFSRFAHVPETDGAVVVDACDLFEGRRPASEDVWTRSIPERLEKALDAVARLEQPIQVALDAHLSVAWYVGRLLDPKAGLRIVLRQKVLGKGVEVWDVEAPSASHTSWSLSSIDVGDGKEMAAVLSVTHTALDDAQRAIVTSLAHVGKIEHATLAAPGPHAIRDGRHAVALAAELTAHLSSRIRATGATRLHLFAACPASLMFLLGQRARLLGPTTVYEFPFGEPTGLYLPGMRA